MSRNAATSLKRNNIKRNFSANPDRQILIETENIERKGNLGKRGFLLLLDYLNLVEISNTDRCPSDR